MAAATDVTTSARADIELAGQTIELEATSAFGVVAGGFMGVKLVPD